MASELQILLERERFEIIGWLVDHLHNSQAPHYGVEPVERLDARLDQLLDALVESFEDGPSRCERAPFVDYVEELARERIGEGYLLAEVQLALSRLEDKGWQLITSNSPRKNQLQQLNELTCVIGAAKDRLAGVYLASEQRAQLRAELLETSTERLLHGTVSPPILDDDRSS